MTEKRAVKSIRSPANICSPWRCYLMIAYMYITCTCAHPCLIFFLAILASRSKSGINLLRLSVSFLSISSYPVQVCFLQLLAVQPIESVTPSANRNNKSVFRVPLPQARIYSLQFGEFDLPRKAQRKIHVHLPIPRRPMQYEYNPMASDWPLNPEKQISIRPIWMLLHMEQSHARGTRAHVVYAAFSAPFALRLDSRREAGLAR